MLNNIVTCCGRGMINNLSTVPNSTRKQSALPRDSGCVNDDNTNDISSKLASGTTRQQLTKSFRTSFLHYRYNENDQIKRYEEMNGKHAK
jgi:hypothetical protein